MRMLHHALSLSTLFLITSGSRFVIAATLFRTSPKSYLDARSACDLLDRPAKCFPRRLDAELRTECLDDGRDDATDREDAALPGRLDPAVLGRRYECFSPTRASVTASVSVSTSIAGGETDVAAELGRELSRELGRELGREETDRSVSVSVSELPPSPLCLRDSIRRVSRPVDADLPPRIIFRMNSW